MHNAALAHAPEAPAPGTGAGAGAGARPAADALPPAAFAAITADSIKRGAKFDCQALGLSIDALRQRDAAAAAQLAASASANCPG